MGVWVEGLLLWLLLLLSLRLVPPLPLQVGRKAVVAGELRVEAQRLWRWQGVHPLRLVVFAIALPFIL